MPTQLLTAVLTAGIAALIKVLYDFNKSLNALLKSHGERLVVLEVKIEDAEEDIADLKSSRQTRH